MKAAKILTFFLLAALIGTDASASDNWGEIRTLTEIVNIRTGRSTENNIIGRLFPGNRVRVDFYEDQWFAVFDINQTQRDLSKALGFVYAPLLKSVKESPRDRKSTRLNSSHYS